MQTETTVEPEVATEPEMTVVDEKPVTVPKYRYGQILPHQIYELKPLIADFYREIGMEKELEATMPTLIQNMRQAAKDPDDIFFPLINEMHNDIRRNPYSIIYACTDSEGAYVGYCWFRVDMNPYNVSYVAVEQDYIVPALRHTLTEARIHDRYIAYMIEVGERCNIQYVNTIVRNKRLLDSRKKLGFQVVESKLRFTGDAAEFKSRNPRFYKYSTYSEVENNGRWKTDN